MYNKDTSIFEYCLSACGAGFVFALFATDMRGFDPFKGVSAEDEYCVLEEVFGLS